MKKTIKLGIIGISPGNGHPYSWSAIFNGYDKNAMSDCPFPVIPQYLSEVKPEDFGIGASEVTHIWTQDRKMSEHIAKASLIPSIVDNADDMIGKVDAVLLARDDGGNHLQMARPFIEAGLPIFIDKPLTDNIEDLREFVKYYRAGKKIMSCSSVRYIPQIDEIRKTKSLGNVLTASTVTPKYWRTYGIHALESIYAIMGGGVVSVQNVGRENEDIVHLNYGEGRHAVIQSFADIKSGTFVFYGEKSFAVIQGPGAFWEFKYTLTHFIEMVKTNISPFNWNETVEMSKIIIAGQISLENDGKIIRVDELDKFL